MQTEFDSEALKNLSEFSAQQRRNRKISAVWVILEKLYYPLTGDHQSFVYGVYADEKEAFTIYDGLKNNATTPYRTWQLQFSEYFTGSDRPLGDQ